jgi:hypothetical protein
VSNNSLKNSNYGVQIFRKSSYNYIYLNNFVNNGVNIYSSDSTNIWNSTLPLQYLYNGNQYTNYLGNYWDDYTGEDANNDGIGDTSYSIDSDRDNYPLMELWENYFAPTNQLPTALFTYTPTYPVVNQMITFDASPSYDPDGNITYYEWSFGDGNTTNTTEKIIMHLYTLKGDYNVNLMVTDNEGAMNSTSKVVTVLKSTPPEEQWNKTFGGTHMDEAWSVQQTSDGGYILAGHTKSYGAGSWDAWLVKTDSCGNELWDKTFGGTDEDLAWSVQQSSDSGYILAGRTESYGAGSYDAWLVKADSRGNEQWNKTFGGTDWDEACSYQQSSDGGYILAGHTKSYGAGSWDAWLVKVDSHGNEQWDKTFGGTDFDMSWSVQQTSDGGYILAGYTCSYGAGSSDFWLVKIDSDGNEQWNKTFGGTDMDVAWPVKQTSDGGYILAGYTCSYGAGSEDFWLVKTDSDGNEQWDKTSGGPDFDRSYSAQQTTDGGYILAGFTGSYGAGSYDAWLVKTDSDGNEQWDKTFGGTYHDLARSVQQTTDGGYILAGNTYSYGAGSGDFWLIKVKGESTTSIFDTGESENPTQA